MRAAQGAREPRRAVQRLVDRGRGRVRAPGGAVPVTAVLAGPGGEWRRVPEAAARDALPSVAPGGVAVLCPTFVARCGEDGHRAVVGHLLSQLAELHDAQPALPLVLWIGMQWFPGREGEEEEAARRLAALGRQAAREAPWLPFAGLCLPGPGKVRTTNAAIRLGAAHAPAGWLWLDDDVVAEPGCATLLVERFLAGSRRGAVGAVKVPLATGHRTSRLLRALGGATAPRRAHPHACCMLVADGVVRGGIPAELDMDDAFVLFELLDPRAAEPFHDLELVEGARCRFYQGAGFGETVRRLRISLLYHLTFMARYSWPAARVYFQQSLFYGLWPLAPWDGSRGVRTGLLRWLVKTVHFGWFAGYAGVLAFRGVTGLRPAPEGGLYSAGFQSPLNAEGGGHAADRRGPRDTR
ncbi:glycosyltransferase family 2 protein [Streptomyces sp. NPDC050617]|uniref:glycosyltransferase family 2 protein n=1 Tax=Streptomyces sp. NPDC050617 TaxID=3154628 RepID=UPI00341F24F3